MIDVPGRTQSPYAQKFLFAASPAKNYTANGNISLLFKQSLFYKASNKTLSTIAIDFADGNGYRNVSWDTPISTSYSSTGLKKIKIKITFTDGTVMQCYSDIEVQQPSSSLARYETPQDFIEGFDPNANHSGGTVYVRYDRNNAEREIDKPLIIVEAYNVSSIAPDLQNDFTFRDLVAFLNSSNNYNFNGQLDNVAGYDLIFLDFNNAADDIRRNAELLEEVIAWVNTQKASAGSTEQNVVMGISMGGLVARYALAEMTKAGTNPGTRLLITHDSPHQGANTPLGIQFLSRAAADIGVVKGLNILDILTDLEQADAVLDAEATKQLLILRATNGSGGTANNTFLSGDYRNTITFPANGVQPTYRIIATSLGAACGEGQIDLEPYDELINIRGKFFFSPLPWLRSRSYNTEIIVNALPDNEQSRQIMKLKIWMNNRILFFINVNVDLTNKSANSPANVLPWDNAPGGTQSVADQVGKRVPSIDFSLLWYMGASLNSTSAEDFCFVPTVSALDISNVSGSVLNAIYVGGFSATNTARVSNFVTHTPEYNSQGNLSSFNETHPRLTARNAEWLFNEMENNPGNNLNCINQCDPPGLVISGPSIICGEDQTYSISEVPPNYTVTWTRSPGLTYVSGQNSTNYTVRRTGTSQGPFWVEAIISGPCQWVNRKDIFISIPETHIELSGETNVCTNEYYWYDFIKSSDTEITGYSWSLPSGWTLEQDNMINENFVEVEVRTGSNVLSNATLMLTIHTACGSRSYPYPVSMSSCGARTSSITVHPNPANDYLEISEEDLEKETPGTKDAKSTSNIVSRDKQTGSTILELKLYNDLLEEVRSAPYIRPSTKINTKDLPTGHYILHIIRNGHIDKRHIFIDKHN